MWNGCTLVSSSRTSIFHTIAESTKALTGSFTRDTGMRLHDIKFQGERIIYSLGLEEAIAQYAGNDPVQSGTAYLGSLSPVRISEVTKLMFRHVLRFWPILLQSGTGV
jgi:hypothetical protein